MGEIVSRRWRYPMIPWILLLLALGTGALDYSLYRTTSESAQKKTVGSAQIARKPKQSIVGVVILGAAAAGIAYWSIALLVNRSTIRADSDGKFTVRHGPLPWPGNVTLEESEIVSAGSRAKQYRSKNGYYIRYDVYVTLDGGREVVALAKLRDGGEAAVIAAEISAKMQLPRGGKRKRS